MKILKKKTFITILAGAHLYITPASAETYKFEMTGSIQNLYAADRNFNKIALPAMTIANGDLYSLSYVFDANNYFVSPTFDADPTTNIYTGYGANMALKIGSFEQRAASIYSDFQLWNDRSSQSLPKTDAFTLGGGYGLLPNAAPVNFGNQPSTLTFNFNAFDYTGLKRSSDLIGEITSLDGWSYIGGSGGFVAQDWTVVSFSIGNLKAKLVPLSAVPEPGTWTMMLLGFGVIGCTIRRKAVIRYV